MEKLNPTQPKHTLTNQKKCTTQNKYKLECGPMPNVMPPCPIQVAPSVQRRKVSLTPSTRVLCSKTAKTRNPLKLAGVPQTNKTISAVSRPKFTILYGMCRGEILLFNKFFSDCRQVLWLRRYSRTKLYDDAQMANFWRFLHPVFAASREQHISDLHSKFALGPRHVQKYGRHPICGR